MAVRDRVAGRGGRVPDGQARVARRRPGQAARAYGAGKDVATSERPYARWIREHADGLQVAGPIVAITLLFFVGVTWVVVIVIGALLVLYELWIRSLSPAAVTAEPPAP